ncbi:acyl-CoA thioesterase [Leptospira wolffii]|uniref:Thioesterase n=1 Tax=Leptospira wolffii TaxID=409998 RepID=A0A2M9ZEM7_9LEPT|nr:acyl-CoA thioesterase [Leptospira wolffii]PJZ66824.1 thioesterase [Leptospira wolffii]TGK61796.1 acyl-CoA thioesterase [Leptospira wolffii]TGK65883.1 acyl-CoA thioesterase [Leptospira wolffii]TGK74819.1 acyl-CoA thioesterase [Leptospira wolffii]TGL30885.1 acyl-CoA thioesterase [Leptospira wolffii]
MRLLEENPQKIGTFSLPVRRADLDVNGHVNNGTYQSYFEEARLKFFESLLNEEEISVDYSDFPVLHCELEYKAELKYPEEATIKTEILRSTEDRIEVLQEMYRSSDSALVTRATFLLGPNETETDTLYSEENYPFAFYHQIGVGWAEMNPEAKVNLDTIQYYLDDARIRSSYQSGLDLEDLQRKGVGPVVYKAELDYFGSLTFPEEIVIATVYQRSEKNRLAFRHDVFSKRTRKLILTSVVHGLFMDLKRKRPYSFSEEDMERVFRTKSESPF